ncbi:MAG TPA: pilus assembly protein PilP [Kofleriaceae bacterium]|nr:pilus assembly protein PilP [Kofleriaceae bacterium]
MNARIYLALLLGVAACGDDDDEGGGKPAARGAEAAGGPRGAARGQQPGVAAQALTVYKQVESLAADEKEAKSLRHQFRDTDFQIDPTGTVNRDPFRSFVINQPGVSTTGGDTTLTAEPTEMCPAKKQIATTYMARELKLTGIVARGTTRWALFSDTAQKGHIVHRNDCIGKEKGRVVEIGASYAKAEVASEPLPGQPQRPPEIIIYQLYPQQLPIGEGSLDDTSNGPAPKGS